MSDTVIIALISLGGTLFGSFAGIVTSGKLTNYRISELEKRVDKLHGLIEKTHNLEKQTSIGQEKIRLMEQRVGTLEKAAMQIN